MAKKLVRPTYFMGVRGGSDFMDCQTPFMRVDDRDVMACSRNRARNSAGQQRFQDEIDAALPRLAGGFRVKLSDLDPEHVESAIGQDF